MARANELCARPQTWSASSYRKTPSSTVLFLVIVCCPVVASPCPPEHFLVPGTGDCHPWLTCSHFDSLGIHEHIGQGLVKSVYRATWKGVNLALLVLTSLDFLPDFTHNLEMLKLYHGSPHIVQLLGHCLQRRMILTEFHSLGDATHIMDLVSARYGVRERLGLCVNFAQLLVLLHDGAGGTRIMCDSNTLTKLLSQLLVTKNFTIILSDLDALPLVDRRRNLMVKCGHRQLGGDFVAPEQLWPYLEPFDDARMPGYAQETDIWKAASVCRHFLGKMGGGDMTQSKLGPLHARCKEVLPERRPTARQLVAKYTEIMEELDREEL